MARRNVGKYVDEKALKLTEMFETWNPTKTMNLTHKKKIHNKNKRKEKQRKQKKREEVYVVMTQTNESIRNSVL